MSFMFKPLAYDDLTAINRPILDSLISDTIAVGNDNVTKIITDSLGNSEKSVLLIDGYVGSNFEEFLHEPIKGVKENNYKTFDMRDI